MASSEITFVRRRFPTEWIALPLILVLVGLQLWFVHPRPFYPHGMPIIVILVLVIVSYAIRWYWTSQAPQRADDQGLYWEDGSILLWSQVTRVRGQGISHPRLKAWLRSNRRVLLVEGELRSFRLIGAHFTNAGELIAFILDRVPEESLK